MTNEQLKKKICDIIAPYVSAYGDDERIADALIAAGIGDVSELKKHRVVVEKSLIPEEDNAYALPNIPPTIKQLYSGEEVEQIVKERDEYKHRAEVAERALYIAAREVEYLIGNFGSMGEFLAKEKGVPYFIEQAEKELTEEKR